MYVRTVEICMYAQEVAWDNGQLNLQSLRWRGIINGDGYGDDYEGVWVEGCMGICMHRQMGGWMHAWENSMYRSMYGWEYVCIDESAVCMD